VAGGACIAGLSLSVINAWLTCISLAVSIVAGALAIWRHRKWINRGGHDE
jgi:hypothetical protein